jgi:hypothetical protein
MDVKTLKLLENVAFPLESQLHVARHLSKVNESLKNGMSKSASKRISLNKGSKFDIDFAIEPLELLTRIKDFGQVSRFENINFSRLEIEFTFKESDFPNGIGSTIVVPLSELTELEKTELKVHNKDGIYYSKINGIQPHITFNLVLVLHRSKKVWEVTTCFPGLWTPSLPNRHKMSEEQLKYAVSFWQDHAIIE